MEDINKVLEEKDQDKAFKVAQGLLKRFGLQLPPQEFCFICNKILQNLFVEYITFGRVTKKVCTECLAKAFDEYGHEHFKVQNEHCFFCEHQIRGMFVPYLAKDRNTYPIDVGCVHKALDEYIKVHHAGLISYE